MAVMRRMKGNAPIDEREYKINAVNVFVCGGDGGK